MSDTEKSSGLGNGQPTDGANPPTNLDNQASDMERAADADAKAVAPEFKRDIHGAKWALTVGSVLSCVFMFALDTTVVADIQPNIVGSLGDFEKFPWLATAYALPAVALTLIQAKLYGLLDIKWLYVGYLVCFEVGSAISGAAPTMDALIVGRMIAGIGGCGIYVGSLTFFSVYTTLNERPTYNGLIAPVWGIGTVLGPVVGGAFAESRLGWRWGFYINLIIFAVSAPILIFMMPSKNFGKGQALAARMAQIDWLGLVIWIGWSVSFFMAVTFGGLIFAWDSYSMIILWVFVGVLAVAFVLSHKFYPIVAKEYRLYPGHLLKNFKLGILQFATFAAASAVYIPIYYIPLYFQFAKGESPVEAAIRLLPFVFMIATVSILQGFLMSKFRYYMPWFLVGSALAVVGSALMYTVTKDTSTSSIYGYSVILGIGGGAFLLTAFGCASDVVEPIDTFNAIGVIGVMQCLGITLFPSLSGNIFQNLGAEIVAPLLPDDFTGDPKSILAGATSTAWTSFPESLQDRLATGIIEAMSKNYIMAIVACGITVVLSPFLGFNKIEK